jgi:hypothetical protein
MGCTAKTESVKRQLMLINFLSARAPQRSLASGPRNGTRRGRTRTFRIGPVVSHAAATRPAIPVRAPHSLEHVGHRAIPAVQPRQVTDREGALATATRRQAVHGLDRIAVRCPRAEAFAAAMMGERRGNIGYSRVADRQLDYRFAVIHVESQIAKTIAAHIAAPMGSAIRIPRR